MSKNNANKFPPEVRERAVRLVQESRSEYPSLWVAVESITPQIGCSAQTLLTKVKRHDVGGGQREGVTTSERERIKKLERKNRELRCANDILRTASAFFRAGGARPKAEVVNTYIDRHREVYGVELICKV